MALFNETKNWITIKHKYSNHVKNVLPWEFENMLDKDDYVKVTSANDDGDGKPDDKWTVADIKSWLDANEIKYTGTHNTKAKLLELVP